MVHYFFGANIGLFFDVLLDWIRSSGTSDSACRLVEPVFLHRCVQRALLSSIAASLFLTLVDDAIYDFVSLHSCATSFIL